DGVVLVGRPGARERRHVYDAVGSVRRPCDDSGIRQLAADDGCAELLQAPGVAGMTDERADRDIILRSEGLRGVRADEAGRTRQQYGFRRHSTGSKLVSRATKGNGLSRFRGSEARSYRSLDDVQGS